MVKNLPANAGAAGDMGLIHGVGRGRSPGEGNGYSLQYSCLENSIYVVKMVSNTCIHYGHYSEET